VYPTGEFSEQTDAKSHRYQLVILLQMKSIGLQINPTDR
jgi:hypothetical protein